MKNLSHLLILILCFSLCGCSSSDNTLHIYSWGDFIYPGIIRDFEEEYQCTVVVDTYDSNESMYAKLKAGAAGYDLAFPSNYFTAIMREQGMLHAIDPQLVPNLKNLDEAYLFSIEEPATEYSIPYAITYTGIGYRNDKVENIEPSWNVFGRNDLRGRMTMLNDYREALGAALRYLGFSANTQDKKELLDAAAQLIRWKKNLAKFESEQYKNGLASAEYIAVQGYSGDILQIMQEDPEVRYLMPQEGLLISCDNLVIPANATSLKLAHAFINFLLDAKNAARNISYTFYVSPNYAAYPLLERELRESPALFPPKDILGKSEVIRNVGPAVHLYHEAWERVKAGVSSEFGL